jgi:hypothetical protein
MNGFLTGDFSFRSNIDPPSSPELIPVADPNEVRFGSDKVPFHSTQCHKYGPISCQETSRTWLLFLQRCGANVALFHAIMHAPFALVVALHCMFDFAVSCNQARLPRIPYAKVLPSICRPKCCQRPDGFVLIVIVVELRLRVVQQHSSPSVFGPLLPVSTDEEIRGSRQ